MVSRDADFESELQRAGDETEHQTDGGELQAYDPEKVVPTMDKIGHAADSMEQFNRILWQIAKSLGIITLMLLMISLLVIAYYAAEFMVTL